MKSLIEQLELTNKRSGEISGLETWYKKERAQSLHTKQQVLESKNILLEILLKENVPLGERLKIEVVFV